VLDIELLTEDTVEVVDKRDLLVIVLSKLLSSLVGQRLCNVENVERL